MLGIVLSTAGNSGTKQIQAAPLRVCIRGRNKNSVRKGPHCTVEDSFLWCGTSGKVLREFRKRGESPHKSDGALCRGGKTWPSLNSQWKFFVLVVETGAGVHGGR